MEPMRNKLVVNENLLVIFSICFFGCVTLICFMTAILPALIPHVSTPVPPIIIIQNVRPCLFLDGNWSDVEYFKVGDKKYICADIETDQDDIQLTFSLYKFNDWFLPIFTDSYILKEGKLTFLIDYSLDPGKYKIIIRKTRPALVEFSFEIVP